MAKKSSQEAYSKWQGIIKAASKYRETIITPEEFKTYSNYYKGRFQKSKSKTDRVEVNKVYSTTNLMTGALVFKEPWIAFKARKDEEVYKSREKVCEEALNNTLQDIQFKDVLEEPIRDTQLYGYGPVKCGYNLQTRETKEKVKDNNGEHPETHIDIEDESVYCVLVDAKRLLLDPTATQGIKDSKFIIEVLIQPKSYIEETYGVPEGKISAGIPAFLKDKFDDLDKESQKIFDMSVFYEIWDIKKKKRLILVEGYPDEVYDFEWPKGLTDKKTGKVEYPYEMLVFNKSPNEPYGISDVSLYRTQQESLNTMRSIESEACKVNGPRWQGIEEQVAMKEVAKFKANVTGSITMVKQKDALSPIQTHNMTQDYDRFEGRLQGDIQDTLGVTDAMSGGGKKNKTATQSYSEDFFARLRLGKRQDKVDAFVLNIGAKLFRIMQREYDTGHFIRIVGPEGKYIAKEYTKKDLEGEYDKVLQQGTGAQNKGYMAQLVGEGLGMLNGNPLIDPKEYTDIIIDVYFDGVDTSKLMVPNAEQIANDPIERERFRQIMLTVASQNQLKQLTNAIMQAGQPPQMPGGSPQPGAPQAMPTAPQGMPQGGM